MTACSKRSAADGRGPLADVELVDDAGQRLARRRLPEGAEGITRLHALIADTIGLDPHPHIGGLAGRVGLGLIRWQVSSRPCERTGTSSGLKFDATNGRLTSPAPEGSPHSGAE